MNREDIISMAREAGGLPDPMVFIGAYERFAALVAAAEREKVAAWMIQRSYATGHGDTIEDLLVELEWQVREAEREELARFFEDHWRENWADFQIAAAIRARGQA